MSEQTITQEAPEANEAPRKPSIFALKGIAVDEAENGRWFNMGDGIQVKLRRFSSKHSLDTRRRLEEAKTHTFDDEGQMPSEVAQEVLLDHTAQSLVVDWRGVYGIDGAPIKCTPEQVKTLFSNPVLEDFYAKVVNKTMEADAYRLSADKEVVKN